MEGEEVRDLVENLLAYRGDIQILEDWLVSNRVERGRAQFVCKALEQAINNYNRIKG